MIPILSMTTSYGQGDSPVFCFVPFILGFEIFGLRGESTGSQLLAGLHFLPGSGAMAEMAGKGNRCHMKPVVLISLIFIPIQVLGSFKAIFCLALFDTRWNTGLSCCPQSELRAAVGCGGGSQNAAGSCCVI